jgi:hypothetical protein
MRLSFKGLTAAALIVPAAVGVAATAGASEFGDMCVKATGAEPGDKMCACFDAKAAGQTRDDLQAYFRAIVAATPAAPVDPASPLAQKGQAAMAGDMAMDCAMASTK